MARCDMCENCSRYTWTLVDSGPGYKYGYNECDYEQEPELDEEGEEYVCKDFVERDWDYGRD